MDALTFRVGSPNPKQKRFFESRARYIAYGGSRGGGKSWAVRKKACLLALQYPGCRLILLRHTLPELRENHILPLLGELKELALYNDNEKVFKFYNGSRLLFGYLENDADLARYQGQEYDFIFIDEATQFTEWQFRALTACLRGTAPLPRRVYLTCNPGGVGHAWVKRLFIQRAYEPGEDPADYEFIAAGIYDNKALLKGDPGYLKRLEALPAEKRRAWLEGRWDVPEGQFFEEFRLGHHVCEPPALQPHWPRYLAMDYGLDMLAALWAAADETGHFYVYREVFEPNLIMSRAAQRIRAAAGSDLPAFCFAPEDLFSRRQDTGRSCADVFAEAGLPLLRVSGSRVSGWLQLREWLAPMGDGLPRLRISPRCRHLIEGLQNLQADPDKPGDCRTEPHIFTHAPDALRYLVTGCPAAAERPLSPKERRRLQNNDFDEFLAYGR